MCLYQQIKQLITSLWFVSVITCKSFAKSLVHGQVLQVTLTFLKPWILKKSAETTFPTWNPLDSKKITCLTSSLVFIGLQSSTKHDTSIVLSFLHLTAQQNLCLYSLPISYLPSKGNCQTYHQSYTVAQVSMKCGFWKAALNYCKNE